MTNLKGKEFEALILFRATKMESEGILTLGRYGVQAVMMNDKITGKPAWQIIKSLPDFDGCIAGGRQLIIEAKVCSQASYPIHATGKKHPKQIDHMLRRAKFGALCFLMVHFNARELMTKSEEACTYAIPVLDNAFWREYEVASKLTLSRYEADLYGIKIPWNVWSSRASKETPDLSFLLPEKPQLILDGGKKPA